MPGINALVLCGGQSTRMGNDKSEIHYHIKSQREYLYELFSKYCNKTFISCNTEQSKQLNHLSTIEDAFENTGPLGGILSAFKFNSSIAWLTVACDLPFMNDQTINYLINGRNPSKMATSFWNNETKFVEPLVTIWEPKAYASLIDFFKQGNKSPGKFLMNADVELLNTPDTFVFKNINTKEEYEETLSGINKQNTSNL